MKYLQVMEIVKYYSILTYRLDMPHRVTAQSDVCEPDPESQSCAECEGPLCW